MMFVYCDEVCTVEKKTKEIILKFTVNPTIQIIKQYLNKLKEISFSFFGNNFYIDWSKIKQGILSCVLFFLADVDEDNSNLICKICGEPIMLSPKTVKLHGSQICIHCTRGCSYCVDLSSLLKVEV